MIFFDGDTPVVEIIEVLDNRGKMNYTVFGGSANFSEG
jgi:hypothetical protein